jgi:hypothetical protein
MLDYLVEAGTQRRGMIGVDGVHGGTNWQGGGVLARLDGEKKINKPMSFEESR